LARDLEGIRNRLYTSLSKRRFAYIPEGVSQYFEQDRLFGDDIYVKFPGARDDIKDAGNCIAANLHTAAVFHLMRVAEFGFRYVAKRARIPLKEKGKPLPVDFAGWEKVIDGLKRRSEALRQTPKGSKRERKAQLYADLSDQCAYIRDIYRDKTMHARKRYNEPEAIAAFIRIKQLMTLLSQEAR
jgi:hypothetical protein